MAAIGFKIHPRPANKISNAQIKRFREYAVANVSDAMSRTNGTQHLSPYYDGETMVGRALTVKTRPGDNLMVHKAIDLAEPGDVIVVDAGGIGPNAIIGEIMASHAAKRGVAGFVIDGLIRDSDTLGQGSFPVFAAGVGHRGPYKDGPGEINCPVSIDGMVVVPGDLVIGDGDGVLTIAPGDHDAIANEVDSIEKKEAASLKAIAEGKIDRSWVDKALREKGVI